MSWTTDATGRVATAEGRVSLGSAGRNVSLQKKIGKEGQTGDVGFHLIGDILGGPTNRLNVVPGNGGRLPNVDAPNLNQEAYGSFERNIRDTLEKNKNAVVEMRVSTRYKSGNASSRPDSFVAEYRVDGGN